MSTHVDPETRYLQLQDDIDRFVDAYSKTGDDIEDAEVLEDLAQAAAEIAELSREVHTATPGADLIQDDADDARFAALLANLATARATGRARQPGLVGEIEQSTYVVAILQQMAGRAEQPGWILAYRLNVLIDHGIAADVHTRLAQRLALAASRRPDGEDAKEHEQADGEQREAHAAPAPPHAA